MIDLSEFLLCAKPKFANAMPRELALSDHPPKQTMSPRAKMAEQIAIVPLGQVELLWPKHAVVQSKVSDSMKMDCLSQFEEITISRRPKLGQQVYGFREESLGNPRRGGV